MKRGRALSLLAACTLTAATIMTTAVPAGPAPSPCETWPGLEPLLGAGGILLVGEIHGTAESPAFARAAACHALAAGLPVVVALELAHGEQQQVDAFLASAGEEQHRRDLLAGTIWSRAYQDGRTSAAMLDLLETLRRWRAGGAAVSVTLFDEAAAGQERDRLMAGRLAQAAQATVAAQMIILTGNVHSRLAPGTPWNKTYEPMGYLLGKQVEGRRLLALNLGTTGGHAWTCNGSTTASCGERQMGGRDQVDAAGVDFSSELDDSGHNGRYHVGPISASPPAASPPSAERSPQ